MHVKPVETRILVVESPSYFCRKFLLIFFLPLCFYWLKIRLCESVDLFYCCSRKGEVIELYFIRISRDLGHINFIKKIFARKEVSIFSFLAAVWLPWCPVKTICNSLISNEFSFAHWFSIPTRYRQVVGSTPTSKAHIFLPLTEPPYTIYY